MFIFILNISPIFAQSNQQQQARCISIRDSSACPEYKDYNVRLPDVDFYSDVPSFDRYIMSNGIFNMGDQVCPNWPIVGREPIAYSTSFACGYIVTLSMTQCNPGKPEPQRLCKDTIDTALNVVQTNLKKYSCNLDTFNSVFGSYLKYRDASPTTDCIRNLGGSGGPNADVSKPCGFGGVNAGIFAKEYCSTTPKSLCCDSTVPNLLTQNSTQTAQRSDATQSPQPNTASSASLFENPLFISSGVFALAFILFLGCALFLMNRGKQKRLAEENSKNIFASPASSNSYSNSSSAPLNVKDSFAFEPFEAKNSPLADNRVSEYVENQSRGFADSEYQPGGFADSEYQPGGLDDNRASEYMSNQPSGFIDNRASEFMPPTNDKKETEYEVIFDYEATLTDEITISVGDKVVIFEEYADGWAEGENLTTGEKGICPMACLGPVGSNGPTENDYEIYIHRQDSKRTSSLPQQRYTQLTEYSQGRNSYLPNV